MAIAEATGRTRGEPQAVTAGVGQIVEAGISADGRKIVISELRESSELLTAEFDPGAERIVGQPRSLLASADRFRLPDLSRDGEWLVYGTTQPRESLYVVRADGTGRRRILDDEFRNRGPRWSPDGSWIVFYSNRSGAYEAWAIRPNGTDLKQITEQGSSGETIVAPTWNRAGTRLLFSTTIGDGTRFVELGPGGLDDLTSPLPLQRTPGDFTYVQAEYSPDDRYLASRSIDAQGESALSIIEVGATTAAFPHRPDGRRFRPARYKPSCLDSHRVVFWDVELDGAMIWDVERQRSSMIPGIEGPATLLFWDDGKRVVIARQEVSSDIWLLELGE